MTTNARLNKKICFKILTASLVAMTVGLTLSPTRATVLTVEQILQLCAASELVNLTGASARPAIEQLLEAHGQPKHLAEIGMREMKPHCPHVY